VGAYSTGVPGYSQYYDGLMAETYFIDGQALEPDNFAESDSTTNQWKPIEYEGTYGDNGWYMKFAGTELADSFEDSATWNDVFTPSTPLTIDVLIVGGGGSGGSMIGGGGGAGGVRTLSSESVSAQAYNVTVGGGGSSSGSGSNGGDSSFDITTSTGGGRGGSTSSSGDAIGGDGGSGGGGRGVSGESWAGGSSSPVTSPVQGYSGGAGASDNYSCGGGGGASEVGVDAGGDDGGNGGDGVSNDYRTGAGVTYGGGGGGGGNASGGSAGAGGGGAAGNGHSPGTPGSNGSANTGGGGGGSREDTGGSGGSGIVVIRYLASSAQATGGTITTYGTGGSQYYVHSFTDVGDNPHTITAVGDVANTRAQQKVGDSSITNFSTSDYLTSPGSSDWDIATNDFTFECWAMLANTSGNQFFCAPGDYDNGGSWGFWWMNSSSSLTFKYYATSSGTDVITRSWSPSVDTWYHIAVVRSSDTWYIFVDGTQLGATASDSADMPYSTAELFYIGVQSYASTIYNPFSGYLDEIRLSDTARYTTTFTPSTTEFTADSNTKLLIHSNWDGGLGADSSGEGNSFTPSGLVATDQMEDSPTNNFCTLNAVNKSSMTLSEGNLKGLGTT
jgi:hypothetical protein